MIVVYVSNVIYGFFVIKVIDFKDLKFFCKILGREGVNIILKKIKRLF